MYLFNTHIVLTRRTKLIFSGDLSFSMSPDRQPALAGYLEVYMNVTGGGAAGNLWIAGTDSDGNDLIESFLSPDIGEDGHLLGSEEFVTVVGMTRSSVFLGTLTVGTVKKDGTPILNIEGNKNIRCRFRDMQVRPNFALINSGIATINDLVMYYPRHTPASDQPQKGDNFTYTDETYEVVGIGDIPEIGGRHLETGVALCRKPGK